MKRQEKNTHEFGLLHAHIDGLISSTKASAYWKDNNSQYLGANNSFINFSGLTTQRDLPGATDQDLVWKSLAGALINNDKHVIENRQTCLFVEQCKIAGTRHSSQSISIDCMSYKSPLLNRTGKVIGLFGLSYPLSKELDRFQLLNEINMLAGETAKMRASTLLSQHQQNERKLSNRELDCFKLLIRGMTTKQIAKSLLLSNRTVEQYLVSLKQKLNCNGRNELTAKAIELGLILFSS